MVELKRKIYKRGSSFETTIPMPLLFALDMSQKHNIIFQFDSKKNKWYINFEEGNSSPSPQLKKTSFSPQLKKTSFSPQQKKTSQQKKGGKK